ncbi:EcsC family protein [Ferviditalea candida]|uniref:EcsC family protein n=1 Tax=Ferviditalea candida TaxID=3108399 RepID=A0ABU5ZGL3_9BACL|nr:EcsC family protein [Paenibacillaceae bacterium T2]
MVESERYRHQIEWEISQWKQKIFKRPGLLENSSRKFSGWLNAKIPDKVHQTVTSTIKGIVNTVLFTAKFVPNGPVLLETPLAARDAKAKGVISRYQKIASAEGAGTGAGGVLLGLVDFPALLAIKMKMLFELAHIYGYDTADLRERLYLLHVFQLAFSGFEQRKKIFAVLSDWNTYQNQFAEQSNAEPQVDWRTFQQEYRDSIDFRKMLQMVPGIGAIVGAWANYSLIDDLGETAINCYRIRLLQLENNQ